MISQTHWLVSRVRLPRWHESLYLLNEQCCHLSRGGSNSQLVCHTTANIRCWVLKHLHLSHSKQTFPQTTICLHAGFFLTQTKGQLQTCRDEQAFKASKQIQSTVSDNTVPRNRCPLVISYEYAVLHDKVSGFLT